MLALMISLLPKYLGVTLDEHLNYNLHVKKLINSVTAKLKQFRRMRSFLNTKAAILVYKCMLLPMLEYGDVFLSATSAINKKRLQIQGPRKHSEPSGPYSQSQQRCLPMFTVIIL